MKKVKQKQSLNINTLHKDPNLAGEVDSTLLALGLDQFRTESLRVGATQKQKTPARSGAGIQSKVKCHGRGVRKFETIFADTTSSDSDCNEIEVLWPNEHLGARFYGYGKPADVKFKNLELRTLAAGELNIILHTLCYIN